MSKEFRNWYIGSTIAAILLLIIGMINVLTHFEIGTHVGFAYMLTAVILIIFINKPKGNVLDKD